MFTGWLPVHLVNIDSALESVKARPWPVCLSFVMINIYFKEFHFLQRVVYYKILIHPRNFFQASLATE